MTRRRIVTAAVVVVAVVGIAALGSMLARELRDDTLTSAATPNPAWPDDNGFCEPSFIEDANPRGFDVEIHDTAYREDELIEAIGPLWRAFEEHGLEVWGVGIPRGAIGLTVTFAEGTECDVDAWRDIADRAIGSIPIVSFRVALGHSINY